MKLNEEELLKIEIDNPSIEDVISVLEEKTGTKIIERNMQPEVDENLAKKLGQKVVSATQVS